MRWNETDDGDGSDVGRDHQLCEVVAKSSGGPN